MGSKFDRQPCGNRAVICNAIISDYPCFLYFSVKAHTTELRALGEGQPEGSRMALYLDQGQESGGALASADSGLLLNAARLGLVPEDGTPVIFYLSDRQNSGSDRVSNTVLNGHRLAEGKVLNGTGGTIREANDPAVPLSGYTIEKNGQNITLPKQPLAYLEWNRIYSMDIYFESAGTILTLITLR